ncbi:MAG: 23S rRNA methyltransferase [Alphaproteobacteria bacterium]|nr:23S rRNA methyltransferase [Alphaproteobacteria bacterium]
MSGRKPGSRSGGRGLTVRVRTARGRKPSSTRWLQRQLNDPYVAEARRSGYRSRAAFKLLELDDRCKLLRPGLSVVDLGAAPGGWTQVAVERTGAGTSGRARVLAVDVLEMEPVAGAETMVLDIRDADAPERLRAALDGPVDVVLSDMAAPTTGHRQTDHLRTMALCEAAADFAAGVLAPGGALVLKAFQGGAEAGLLALLKRDYARVRHVKPPASRDESPETYLVATGFRRGIKNDKKS